MESRSRRYSRRLAMSLGVGVGTLVILIAGLMVLLLGLAMVLKHWFPAGD